MRDNPINFAVVREDPAVEAEVLARTPGARQALLVASGGCTALSLATLAPDVTCTLFDINAQQLEHVRRKQRALAEGAGPGTFNVGWDDPSGLNQCGNFESLFRGLRDFLRDLVAPQDLWREAFIKAGDGPLDPAFLDRVKIAKYWPVAFQLFFSDSMLHAMFGPEATQYAPSGSYPGYFQRVFERGLRRGDVGRNYFLHHILLGHYLDNVGPAWLAPGARHPEPFKMVQGEISVVVDRLDEFDLISLSNIFDWVGEENARRTARIVAKRAKRGAAVVLRQLNNTRDLSPLFAPEFTFDHPLGESILASDRSLFYSRITVGWKR